MAEAYLTQEDLNMRLAGSICTYDGEPVFVATDGDRCKWPMVRLFKCGSDMYKAWKIIDHTDPLFCDRSPILGYMNYQKQAYYLQRVPFRYQNQGLKDISITSAPRLDRYEGYFASAAMGDCIKGIYPKKEEALANIKDGWSGCAIHRSLAIARVDNRSTGLYYKARLVALWNDWNQSFEYIQASDSKFIKKIINRLGVL